MTSRSKSQISEATKCRIVVERSLDMVRGIIRGMAGAFVAAGVLCHCKELRQMGLDAVACSGHVNDCPVHQAVRHDLMNAGIV